MHSKNTFYMHTFICIVALPNMLKLMVERIPKPWPGFPIPSATHDTIPLIFVREFRKDNYIKSMKLKSACRGLEPCQTFWKLCTDNFGLVIFGFWSVLAKSSKIQQNIINNCLFRLCWSSGSVKNSSGMYLLTMILFVDNGLMIHNDLMINNVVMIAQWFLFIDNDSLI